MSRITRSAAPSPLPPLFRAYIPAYTLRRVRAKGLVVAAFLVYFIASAPAAAQLPAVNVFPTPGTRLATPATQITFRGVNVLALTGISVTGSRSGSHAGTIAGDSDGDGGSFEPTEPFVPGETVTVKTPLNVVGGKAGTFSFTIVRSPGPIPFAPAVRVARVPGDVWGFSSRPDLVPPAVRILTTSKRAAPGDIFLAPQFGPVQNGPEIVDPSGNLIWFDPVPNGDAASDFRVQQYRGMPVLTWWQGWTNAGIGFGQDVIYDSTYNPLAIVKAANGLSADLHEFQLTPKGTALVTAYYPVYWNATALGGRKREIVLDSIVQEIDIPTGLVLFQWDSLAHVPLTDTYESLPPPKTTNPFDYFHVNSVQLDDDGNLIISGRNTWATYKVSHRTGAVIWTLGGKHSSFKMGPGTSFAFQHDVRVEASGDQYVTVFDDGAGPPTVHTQSRALKLRLNFKRWTATAVDQYDHSPPLLAQFEGSYQQLPDADDFVGWGQEPYFSEYDSRGRVVLDGRFVGNTSSYRSYKFAWQATPTTLPAVAASTAHGKTTVYMSWNGATTVGGWRVLAGPAPTALTPARAVLKQGFETSTTIPVAKYVAVQALGVNGQLLATSSPVSVP